MSQITVINRFAVKPGRMDEFVRAQQQFGSSMEGKLRGFLGGRMYRSPDNQTAVLLSQFTSVEAQQALRQEEAFRAHVARLQPLLESASPEVYEEAYTAGAFR